MRQMVYWTFNMNDPFSMTPVMNGIISFLHTSWTSKMKRNVSVARFAIRYSMSCQLLRYPMLMLVSPLQGSIQTTMEIIQRVLRLPFGARSVPASCTVVAQRNEYERKMHDDIATSGRCIMVLQRISEMQTQPHLMKAVL